MLLGAFICYKIAGNRSPAGYVLNNFCCENPKNYKSTGEISVFQHDVDKVFFWVVMLPVLVVVFQHTKKLPTYAA